MELMVPIDNQSRLPLYEQIYQYMKEEIQSGRISAGSRLPSTRILAENLKVSRSTTHLLRVNKSYSLRFLVIK